MHRLVLMAVALVALVLTANAVAATGWKPATAAAKLKATYATVDPKAAAVVQANIDQEKAGCQCDTDARIVSLEATLKLTQTAAKPQAVSCKGAGRATKGRYSRFHCTVKVVGTFRAPPDYVLFTATKKLTVLLVPFRVLAGWR